jgi:hypothetical protein
MFTRHQMEEVAEQLEALAGHSGDAHAVGARMLRHCAKDMPQPGDGAAWQQRLQADQVRLGLMPGTGQEGNAPGLEPIHNHGDSDGPASEDYSAPASDTPVDPPSSEEPSA